ncbi:MAG: methyltransferase domain-containing protein [Phycisphaerales bacterium]|nr:MAG: methyltransferase domain-containing protein [Phycisphaerales bacterium]
MPDSSPKPEIITRLLEAVYPSFALVAGMVLDLFTPLEAGPLSLEQLSDALGVQESKLRPLIYALVAGGLLTVEDDLFSNTAEAKHFLVHGKPSFMGGKGELVATNWIRMLKTAATIRAGEPPDIFDFHSKSQDDLELLFRGLYPGAVADGRRLMDQYDFSGYRTLLDAGGGSGGLAISLARANPQLKATVLDLPTVTPITKQFIDEAEVGARVEIVAADAVRDVLTGSYGAVVARHVIQVLSEEDSRALLKNLAAVLKPRGTLYIIGWILDDSRMSPDQTVGSNLVLLNTTKDGQAYTEGEYREWMKEAGFIDFERRVLPDGVSFVRAGIG